MLVLIILFTSFHNLFITCVTVDYDTGYILNYIKNRNYPVEVHTIKTEDGYILNLHRIPHGRNNTNHKGVVLLAHGLEESAEHWVINGDKSLAFLLPDLGYDVWMTNARGSYHSRKHIKWNINNSNYWDFSWHEIGVYDLPVTIDYILNETESTKISYIGHSQGATTFFVLTSLKPEYNAKIKIMIGLAPAAYMFHVRNPVFRTLSNVWELIYPKKGALDNALMNSVAEQLCKQQFFFQSFCSNLLFLMAGYDYEQLEKDLIPDIMRSMPAGSSTKQFIHYFQLIRSGYFRQYDYLTEENLRRYNEASPPKYNLSQITTKIAVYYSKNDWLASLEDVQRLRDELPNVVEDHLIEYEKFNHWDFLFAKDVIPLLYNHVIETLNKYN